ncbi:MAG: GNAT family N-acetyltransferase [Hyphomicrobium sp.]|jgi:hypothetical protein
MTGRTTDCTIDWSPVTAADWDEHFRLLRRSTLLQHFPYAKAERVINQIGARHGIIKIDGVAAGLVQIGEVGLFRNLVHVVNLDRGPMWFEGFDTALNAAAFFAAFSRQFPKRFGRRIRVLPELEDCGPNRALMEKAGLRRNDRYHGYETIWVDLTSTPDRLRAKLDGNWRRFLGKAERTHLTVAEDWTCETAGGFLATYAADRAAKNYSGPSQKMLDALLTFMVPRGEAVILNALDGEKTVAALLILIHGTSATYQVGWNLPEGRKLWAHHRLFWHAMLMLRDRGVRDFDLGGINDESAQGIKRFKEGLGGQFVKLVGFYA